jgi:hypothetical protein
MGCGSSAATPTTASSISALTPATITDFAVHARQVKQTWPDVKKINKLGAKTFA